MTPPKKLTVARFDAYCEAGVPRLVLDTAEGGRVFAAFAVGAYADERAHYWSAVRLAVQRMGLRDRVDLVGDLLDELPPVERADVLVAAVERFSTATTDEGEEPSS